MAYTYTELTKLRARIVDQLSEQQDRISVVRAMPADISAKLTAMQSLYGGAGGWYQQVTAMAAANPGNEAMQVLKAQADEHVREFSEAKAIADALNTAVNS